jgi:hypothetical protein
LFQEDTEGIWIFPTSASVARCTFQWQLMEHFLGWVMFTQFKETEKSVELRWQVSSKVTLRVELEKNKKLDWPRIESKDEIMTVCSAKPLEDAVRLAFLEMIKWLEADYGFERCDAYMFLSLAAKARVAQVVDPLFTVVAKLPKKMLPKSGNPK